MILSWKEKGKMDLERKVIAYMKQHHIIKQKQKIILGLSGGADSVCLFHVLLACREKYKIALFAAHVNHGIRGIQAKEDQNFVEQMCASYQVPLKVIEADVPAMAKKEKKSLEEAGRHIRYQAFRELQQEVDADYIAVAHHKNDQAETVLHNLCRGSGLAGLSGMQAKRNGIIRPLLCVEREEIETYLKTKGQPYQIDCTNLDNTYTRNKWRNEILPLMRTEINAQTISHIADTASMMGEVVDFVEEFGKCAFQRMIETKDEKMILDLEKWKQEHVVIQKWILQKMVYQLSGKQKDIGQVHVLDMMELTKKQVGKSLDLPYNLQAKRVYQGILLEKRDKANHAIVLGEQSKEYISKENGLSDLDEEKEVWKLNPRNIKLLVSKVIKLSTYQIQRLEKEEKKEECRTEGTEERINEIQFRKKVICLQKRKREEYGLNWETLSKKTPKNNCTKWFDYDKIKGSVLFRRMEKDDFLQIDDVGHHKKIKKLFKDEKIDAKEREKIWLLAEGNHVIWIPGIRMSEAYKIDKSTKEILEVTIKEEE